MKLPIQASPVARYHTAFLDFITFGTGVKASLSGTCYDNTDCNKGIFRRNVLCDNCSVAQCDNLGGLAWKGSLRNLGRECWEMNAGLLQREQLMPNG